MKEQSKQDNNRPAELAPDDVAVRERIEQRAYHLWLASGRGHGEHLNHWLQAEGEILKAIQLEQEQRTTIRKSGSAPKQRPSPPSHEAFPK